jgi:triacylglycerol lipase
LRFQPRLLPDETIEGLRPPARGFPYFQHADQLTFDVSTTDYSAVNAWWLADASLLVYGDAVFVEQVYLASPLPHLGWQLGWVGSPENNRGMVLYHDTAVVVVFRGTRLDRHQPFTALEFVMINQDDLWTDSQFLLTTCEAGGRVHAGFAQVFREISSDIDTIVQRRRPGQRLFLAGHSLGGALATLAAAHIDPNDITAVYTYGSPRIGDSVFAANLPSDRYFRCVYGQDWVATVPPDFLGYVHAGQLQNVSGGPVRNFWGDLMESTGELVSALRAMAQQQRLDIGELPFKISSLVQHAPVYYATLLWNMLVEQRSR